MKEGKIVYVKVVADLLVSFHVGGWKGEMWEDQTMESDESRVKRENKSWHTLRDPWWWALRCKSGICLTFYILAPFNIHIRMYIIVYNIHMNMWICIFGTYKERTLVFSFLENARRSSDHITDISNLFQLSSNALSVNVCMYVCIYLTMLFHFEYYYVYTQNLLTWWITRVIFLCILSLTFLLNFILFIKYICRFIILK